MNKGVTINAATGIRDQLRINAINIAVDELFNKKQQHGRLPQGTMRQVITDLKDHGVNTNRDRLNYLLKKKS
jgi:hypothetical protein